MSKFSKEHLMKFLITNAGGNALRKAGNVVSQEMISAAKYYMGVPDGKYFELKDFDKSVVEANKAYVTLNTIMGGSTSEVDRFNEGKKQIPELLTPLGVKKMIHLFTHLYCFASGSKEVVTSQTVRACRQSEVSEGESVIEALTSTTKLTIDEIMNLGYGNKNGLAICCYKFHYGSVALDMEKLGKDYLKPEEREVLILMGNELYTRVKGYDERYLGKDGCPALVYEVDVYSPKFNVTEKQPDLENVVYDSKIISEVKEFYEKLNESDNFPEIPGCYFQWKDFF